MEVIHGLQNLIKSLRIHWGRLPMFLVDEIDKPCVAAMEYKVSETQVQEVGTTIIDVVCSILKSSNKQHLQTSKFWTVTYGQHNAGIFLSDDRFSKYYELTAREVESLVRKFYGSQGKSQVGKIISDINAKYNGYYQCFSSGKNEKYARYSLFSILNYIKEMNKDKNKVSLCFWMDGGFLTGKLVPILKKSDMFEDYHNDLPEAIKSKFTSCGQIFKSLPTQNSTDFQESLDKLCEDFKCIFRSMQCESEASICCHILAILKHYAHYEKGEMEYTVQYFDNNNKPCRVYIDVWGRHGNFIVIFEVKYNSGASGEPGKIGSKAKSFLAAAKDIVKLLHGKITPEDRSSSKAGTGRDLEVLKSSQIEHYILVSLAVGGDYTTHMLVFQDTPDWESIIQVNPENHVAKLISTHLKSK
ncbi:hypothetical protein BDFB_013768, partial [Asbolus verrucosus]